MSFKFQLSLLKSNCLCCSRGLLLVLQSCNCDSWAADVGNFEPLLQIISCQLLLDLLLQSCKSLGLRRHSGAVEFSINFPCSPAQQGNQELQIHKIVAFEVILGDHELHESLVIVPERWVVAVHDAVNSVGVLVSLCQILAVR